MCKLAERSGSRVELEIKWPQPKYVVFARQRTDAEFFGSSSAKGLAKALRLPLDSIVCDGKPGATDGLNAISHPRRIGRDKSTFGLSIRVSR